MRQLALLVGAFVFAALGGGVSAAGVGPLPAANGYVQCLTTPSSSPIRRVVTAAFDNGTVAYSPDASLQANAFGEGLDGRGQYLRRLEL